MNKKKIIATILIVGIVFTGIVMAKNCFSYKIPNESMGIRSVVAKKEVDTLFVGASAFRKGIDMEMIVNSLPGQSFMLTYNGNEPFNIYVELKELLKEDVHIGRLVVDFNPSMMDRGADLSDKRLLWDISMEGKKEIWEEIAKNEDTTFFDFYDYWVLSNNDYMVTYPVSYPLIASRYYYGGSTPSEDSAGKSYEELMKLPVVENPGLNELEKDSILNIVKLCKENDIELIFLESPRFITMESNENYRDKADELEKILENENVKCILAKDLDFDNTNSDFYSDLTHMSGEGKKEYTRLVVEQLLDSVE